MDEQRIDYDSPWKEMLERYFEKFMAFFFPEAYEDIDWLAPFEFLDAELQQVVRDAELGRRYADKLVKVRRKDGQEIWVLVHPGRHSRAVSFHRLAHDSSTGFG